MVYSISEMNRAFWMRNPLLIVYGFCLSAAACQPHTSSAPSDLGPPPATLPCCQYTVSGDVSHPGPRILAPGDTVSSVLPYILSGAPGKPITLVLIRQAPEGKTRQLIQLDPTGKLMDEKQNWVLRNGDELEFPGGQNPNTAPNLTGPTH
jgi:hypothetical protein